MRGEMHQTALLLWRLEAVANSAQRLQILRVPGIDLDFFPQPPHVNVDRARRYEGSLFPHRIEQLVACKHAPALRSQILQQPKFPDGRKNYPALYSHRH